MDYFELANKASSYAFISENSGVFYLICLIFIAIFALAAIFLLIAGKFEEFTTACIAGFFFCVIFLSFNTYSLENARKLDELRKLASDNNISSLDDLVNNADYLSDRYSEKLDTFEVMYRDNIPSEKEYVNNILTEFYTKEPISGDFDYSTEYEEAVEHLR